MIQLQKDLLEMVKYKRFLADDVLEAYIEYSKLYCLDAFLGFLEERLRRIEQEVYIL